ncbi:MAG: dihydrolipoamide acetyltransferase [Myxococcales bacterium]|nr:dihydrolipoamide acetyltransferase [Myxococcales bacterium]
MTMPKKNRYPNPVLCCLVLGACLTAGSWSYAQDTAAETETPAVEAEKPAEEVPAAEGQEPAKATDEAPAAQEGAPAESTEAAPAEGEAAATPDTAPAATQEGAAPQEQSPEDAEKAMREMKEADASYRAKIRGLEEKVNELKESIFRSKAKLMMLTEQVTGGLSTSAKLLLVHENQMGSGFRLVQRHFFLDGMPLHQDTDESGERFQNEGEIIIFDGPIVEGTHTLTVSLVYRGSGSGLFSYLEGYNFQLKDSFTFTTEQGKITTNKVVGFEQGDFTTNFLERPAIRMDTEVLDDRVEDDLDQGIVVP